MLEQRHDWATFNLTPELFKYVLTRLIPDIIFHTQSQDEEQVRDHYDRKQITIGFIAMALISSFQSIGGDDFYGW